MPLLIKNKNIRAAIERDDEQQWAIERGLSKTFAVLNSRQPEWCTSVVPLLAIITMVVVYIGIHITRPQYRTVFASIEFAAARARIACVCEWITKKQFSNCEILRSYSMIVGCSLDSRLVDPCVRAREKVIDMTE